MMPSGGILVTVYRNAVPWSTHWGMRILGPMSYLKLWNYIYRPSVPACPFRRRRRRHPSVRQSRRPSRRPHRRRRPSSVRPSRRVPSYPVVTVVVLCPSVRSVIRPVPSSSVLCPSHPVRPSPARRPYQLMQSNGCILFRNVARLQNK